MNTVKIWIVLFITWITSGLVFSYYSKPRIYEQGFEAGKRFARDSLLNLNDSLIHYSGIPDSVLNKNVPELSNKGSYKIHGKGLK